LQPGGRVPVGGVRVSAVETEVAGERYQRAIAYLHREVAVGMTFGRAHAARHSEP
jgi:hypothetical protein